MVWRGQQARLMTQKLLKTELGKLPCYGKRPTAQLKLELDSILGCTCHSLVAVPGSTLFCLTHCIPFTRLFLKTPRCLSAEGIQRIPPDGANHVQLIPQGQDIRDTVLNRSVSIPEHWKRKHLPNLESLFSNPASLTAAGPYSTPSFFCES